MPFDLEYFLGIYSKFEADLNERLGDDFDTRIGRVGEVLNSGQPLYRGCNDKLFLYISLCRSLCEEDYLLYNMHEGARVIPLIYNLAEKWDRIESILNYEDKISELCSDRNANIDATLFEILVALKYLDLGYSVEFVPESAVKTPDLKITKDGVFRFVECKKMQRGNKYSYTELDKWYEISKGVAKIVREHQINGHIHFKFLSELTEVNPKRVFRKVLKKIDVCKRIENTFHIVKNKDFRIKFSPIDSSKFNCDLDPLKNITGPSFVEYLTGTYNPNLNYKPVAHCLFDGRAPFVSSVRWGAVISGHFANGHSKYMRAQHIKKRLAEATKQLRENSPGDVHILVEDCNGRDVYHRRIARNFEVMANFKDGSESLQRVYLHSVKYIVPLNELFDVEETVMTFNREGCLPENISEVWYKADTMEEGFGTMLDS